MALAACGGSSPSPKLTHRSGQPLLSVFWADTQLQADPLRTMQALKGLGVQVVRTSMPWANILNVDSFPAKRPPLDTTDPAAYPAAPNGFSLYDKIDRAAAATGVQLYVTLEGPGPLWAAGRGHPNPATPAGHSGATRWRPSPAAFGQFVQAVGERYSGHYTPPGEHKPLPRIHFWSIWNEPNYGNQLSPQATKPGEIPISPSLYRGLVNAAWRGLEASGHTPANDTILIGETAPYGTVEFGGPGYWGEMVPLKFIRALYCVGSDYQPLQGAVATGLGCPASPANFRSDNPGLFNASGWADHPYTGGKSPSLPTTGVPGSADYADLPALRNLEHTLDKVTAAHGADARFPIYNTEFGYLTNPPNTEHTTVSPTRAARYMNEAEYLSWINPRVRSYDQYELTDQNAQATHNFDSGLEYYSGERKPSYYAYRMPLWIPRSSGRRGSRLEVWGCARAAPVVETSTGRAQTVQIQFAPPGGNYRSAENVTLDPARDGCYFDTMVKFPGSGSVRLAWKARGTVEYSRVQSISIT